MLGFTHYLHAEAEILRNLINFSLPIVNSTRDQHLQHLTEVRMILPLKNESWNSGSIIRFTVCSQRSGGVTLSTSHSHVDAEDGKRGHAQKRKTSIYSRHAEKEDGAFCLGPNDLFLVHFCPLTRCLCTHIYFHVTKGRKDTYWFTILPVIFSYNQMRQFISKPNICNLNNWMLGNSCVYSYSAFSFLLAEVPCAKSNLFQVNVCRKLYIYCWL